ncbi:unnamed protein product [Linum tenue]|uniref:Carbonic anhydrase n=1 Tax=Linum tenue TaxID=586396 RepID=A0AAV0M030_9ROSI|nr:unnamed protein product [Linum tenue]
MNDAKLKPTLLIFCLISSLTVFCRSCYAKCHDHDQEFNYDEGSGRGPSEWGSLDPNWRACGEGKSQSPIELYQMVKHAPELGKLKRAYRAAPATIANRGHDVAVTWKGDAGKIRINGTTYRLQQCHWHTPSEHSIYGKRFDMELHMVHSSYDGSIAVVAFLYMFGESDPFLSMVNSNLSTQQLKLCEGCNNNINSREHQLGRVNPKQIGFPSEKYYRYGGSLTTPPCTEGVIWTIFQQVPC